MCLSTGGFGILLWSIIFSLMLLLVSGVGHFYATDWFDSCRSKQSKKGIHSQTKLGNTVGLRDVITISEKGNGKGDCGKSRFVIDTVLTICE